MIMIVWRLKRWCAEVRANGGKLSHCLGQQFEQPKIITNIIQLGLRWPPSDDGERNNQPKIDGREVDNTGEDEGDVMPSFWG